MLRSLALALALLRALPAAALDRAAPPITLGPGSTGSANALTILPTGELVSRTLADLARLILLRTGRSQYDFGAKCDGSTDDTTALQAWLAAGQNERLVLAPGVCIFKQPLAANYDGLTVTGAGKSKAFLVYAGTSTTADLITLGDGANIRQGLDLSGFRVLSNTKMTQGSALRIRRYQNAQNKLREVSFGDKINGNYNLYNGPWFDNINVVSYTGFDIAASYDGIRVNGSQPGLVEGSDLFLDDGVIVKATTGIRVGGGFGGLETNTLLLIANDTDMRIDTTLTAVQNREIIIGANTVFDQTRSYGLYVDDALAGGSSINIDAFMGSAGRFNDNGAASPGENIHIENWKNSYFIVGSTRIFNAISHNVVVNDPTTSVVFSQKTVISDAGGYGITGNALTTKVFGDPLMTNNASGNKGPNIRNPLWTAFTPGITSTSGAFTATTINTAQFKVIGGICTVSYDFTIGTAGSAGGAILVNLPSPARTTGVFVGREIGVSNRSIAGSALAGQNLAIVNYDGTSVIQNGARVALSGSYDCN